MKGLKKRKDDLDVHTLEFDNLVQETINQSTKLIEYFRLRLVYYQLISGKGLEFEKIVDYSPGKDLKRLDWLKFAKTGKLMIRSFREERKFNIVIVIDVSDTMLLGTSRYTKNQFSSILAGAIGFAANEAGDNIALTMFSDKIEISTDPSSEYFSMLNLLSKKENYGGKKSWSKLMRILPSNYESDSILFIVSDFIDSDPDKFVPELANNFAKVYGVMIRDPLDNTLPSGVGKMYIYDHETNTHMLTDLDAVKEEYEVLNKKHIQYVKEKFEENDQLFMNMTTNEEFDEAFMKALGQTEVVLF